MWLEISGGERFWSRAATQASPFSCWTTAYGTFALCLCVTGVSKRCPIRRLTAYTVCSGFVAAWRLATCPTKRSPLAVNATTEGVVRAPSVFGITLTSGCPDAAIPSTTATHEFVVPRSMPMILAMPSSGWLALGDDHERRAQHAIA